MIKATPFEAPVNRDIAFLYEGYKLGELRVQVCTACNEQRHPPSPTCLRCHSFGWTTRTASGKGRVHSYTWHHYPPIPPWPTPHAIVLANMEEGFRFMAAMPGVTIEALRIGMPVSVGFGDDSGAQLPFFYEGSAP